MIIKSGSNLEAVEWISIMGSSYVFFMKNDPVNFLHIIDPVNFMINK